ncbi:unnamed protein product [Adineta steineri]|uniref:G-protein coupled receptors family 1 profile domain-containing protein n=1 Tax=Adineta steineri TaxID=433720 RepID=A0A816D477_9BILA|nr:unnamed protein product [Adineta steineri]CAF1629760.1 unnamed protein product [Adineta steineri]
MINNNTTTTVDLIQTSKSLIDDLNFVSQNILIYLPLTFLIFGLIGFIGNVFTYLQPQLCSNTCCIYSLCGSFIDIINLCINSFPNYFSGKYGITLPWFTVSGLCKFSIFLLGFLPYLSISFLCMAIIDRFAITCDHTSSVRRITQLRKVPWMISLTVLTSGLFTLYAPLHHGLVPIIGCASTNPTLTGIAYIIFSGLLQPITMITFVLLTYRNVLRSRGRVGDTAQTNGRNLRNQFIVTIFAQILVTSFISMQWVITYMYFTFTLSYPRTFVEFSIVLFVFNLSNNFYYLNNVKAFYISILTSRVFRKTLFDGLKNLYRRHIRQQMNVSMVNPFTQTRDIN